jgi:hypothetical protein
VNKYFIVPQFCEIEGWIWEVRQKNMFWFSTIVTKYPRRGDASKLSQKLNRDYRIRKGNI